jgi:hypothetical protein
LVKAISDAARFFAGSIDPWRSFAYLRVRLPDLYCFSNALKAKYFTNGIDVMKRGSGMRLILLLGLAALAVQPTKAASAVAIDGNGRMSISFGHTKEFDEHSALDLGRRHGPNVRILAASDVTGYCAIASGPRRQFTNPRDSWVYGIALGRATREEAVRLAIEQCLKGGGTNPKIKSEFRG